MSQDASATAVSETPAILKRPVSESALLDEGYGNSNLSSVHVRENVCATTLATVTSVGSSKKAKTNNHKHQSSPKMAVRSKNMDPTMLQWRRTIQKCCATDDLVTAVQVYDEVVKKCAASNELVSPSASLTHNQNNSKRYLEPQTFYNLLNLCGGLSDRGIHIGTPQSNNKSDCVGDAKCDNDQDDKPAERAKNVQVDLDTRMGHADRIVSHMKELQIPLTESCYTALIKLHSRSTTRVTEAELLLDEAERTQQCRPRLRMYAPLLIRYCEDGLLTSALGVWLRVMLHDLTLSEREYAALLRCAVSNGSAATMERVLSDLAEEVLVPCRDTRQAIVDWFRSPASRISTTSTGDESSGIPNDPEVTSLLQSIPSPYPYTVDPMGPVVAKVPWTISENCGIDSQGSLLSGCLQGDRLQPTLASEEIVQELLDMNESIVLSGRVDGDQSDFQGGRKGRKKPLDETALDQRRQAWTEFLDYLKGRDSLDVVVDGANVGYFETNFAGAPKHVDYHQIDWIVQHFLERKTSVAVFLHVRHVSPPLMPSYAEPIVRAWRQQRVLYSTPKNMNDDWFWLHAALIKHSLVVTNDEMRDHHFQMLAQRGFVRWKDRHQIHFRFGSWMEQKQHQKQQRRNVELVHPEAYSRRIQRVQDGLVIPMPKRGDENRFLDGSHRATEEAPDVEMYLCIRPEV